MSSPQRLELRPAMDYGLRTAQRHITTINSEGKSVLVPDQDILYCDRGGYAVSWTYAVSECPAVLTDNKDLNGFFSADPQSTNSVFNTGTRIVNGSGVTFNTTNFAPGTETVMHRTLSLDFVAVVDGEMELELDSGDKVLLKPGVRHSTSSARLIPVGEKVLTNHRIRSFSDRRTISGEIRPRTSRRDWFRSSALQRPLRSMEENSVRRDSAQALWANPGPESDTVEDMTPRFVGHIKYLIHDEISYQSHSVCLAHDATNTLNSLHQIGDLPSLLAPVGTAY